MEQNSRSRSDRPAKPYLDFPLFPHATRRWAKKIKGKFVFFGPWDDPHGALQRYLAQRDELHAGRAPARAHGAGRRQMPARGRHGVHAGDVAETDESTNVLTGHAERPAQPSRSPAQSTVAGAGGQLSIRDLVNHFLTAKKRRLDAEEMGLRSFSEYHATAGRLVKFFGKDRLIVDLVPDDFSRLRATLAKARGPLSLGNEVGRVRSIFKHGYEAGVLDRPIRFGPDFSKPAKRAVRLARRAAGVRMFEPAEIKELLEAAGPQMRAMILLGLNCGLGNTDVAELPRSAVDLKAGMLEFPRPKTGINRRGALWPETIDALKAVAKARPAAKSKEDEGQVFLTKYGRRWVRVEEPGERSKGRHKAVVTDAVALEFCKLARALKLEKGPDGPSGRTAPRPRGRGFYALRHTFRTVADEVGDRPAVDLVMGHENGADIATQYIERIGDERLRRVAEHVRAWSSLSA